LKERDALLKRADKAWEQSQALHELAEREILQKLRDALTSRTPTQSS
jgi:hypothetical protein